MTKFVFIFSVVCVCARVRVCVFPCVMCVSLCVLGFLIMSEIVEGFQSYMVSVPGKKNCRHQLLIIVVTIDFDILVLLISIFGAS